MKAKHEYRFEPSGVVGNITTRVWGVTYECYLCDHTVVCPDNLTTTYCDYDPDDECTCRHEEELDDYE